MCRKKKIKCDGKLPACTHCTNSKTDCVFTQVEKKRTPPKGCVDRTCPRLDDLDVLTAITAPSILRDWRTDWAVWNTC